MSYSRAFIDLRRRQVGAWRVIWRDSARYREHVLWICRCVCGTVKSLRGDVLRRRESVSCGCMNRDQADAHEASVLRDEREESLAWH